MKTDIYIRNGLLIFIMLVVWAVSSIRAEDNKTILVDPRPDVILKNWTSQLIYDTTNACYQGTIRWIVLSIPTLMGKPPTWQSQRQMIEHCFCVMDRIRKEIKIEDYQKLVYDPKWTGNTFMIKAMECVKEEKTLPSFFVIQGDEGIKTTPIPKGKTDNPAVVPDGETEDSKEESPDQKQEESEGSPETIFQG